MARKRTKAVDITGKFVYYDDRIERYKNVPIGAKCSHCIDGLDPDCIVCHGSQIKVEPKIKWYQLKKRFEKWLE